MRYPLHGTPKRYSPRFSSNVSFCVVTKYRHKVFNKHYRGHLKAVIEKIGCDYDIEIVELEIPVDHIHMVVRSVPKICLSDIMQIIRSLSAREFFRLHSEIKKRYFWGGKLFLPIWRDMRLTRLYPIL